MPTKRYCGEACKIVDVWLNLLDCTNVQERELSPDNLPAIPARLLRAHAVAELSDDRFRSCARLLQALWRENEGLLIGDCVSPDGTVRSLGSRIAHGAETGRNFLTPDIAQVAWHETVYRERGAVIDEDRLWSNLLSSQALAFNVLGPMRLDLDLATAFLRAMSDDLADVTATSVVFEHSPGRRDPSLTGDCTAFDAVIRYHRADERSGFVALEFKYSESGRERQGVLAVSCEAALVASHLFEDPCASSLRAQPLQQLVREHVLAQAIISRGDYDEGRLVVIAPALNPGVASACDQYRALLADPTPAHARFATWTLDDVIAVLGRIGYEGAEHLHRRYLDWNRVARAIEETRPDISPDGASTAQFPSRKRRANAVKPRSAREG